MIRLSYILLLVLILTGWMVISFIQQPQLNSSNTRSIFHSSLTHGNTSYYENGSPIYSFSYQNASYYSKQSWIATIPQLIIYNGSQQTLVLNARQVNSSRVDEFLLSGGVHLVYEDGDGLLKASRAHIRLNPNSIQLYDRVEFNSQEVKLSADRVDLTSLSDKQISTQAHGSPLRFQYQSLDGQAEQADYQAPLLLLNGDVRVQDNQFPRQFSAQQMTLTTTTLELSDEVHWQQDGISLYASHVLASSPQLLQATGQPVRFYYQSISGQAQTLIYKDGQLELERQAILNDENHQRQLRAEQLLINDEVVEAKGDSQLRQGNWTLIADKIYINNASGSAFGDPLHIYHSNLTINATEFHYDDPLVRIKGNPLHLVYTNTYGVYQAEGSLLESDSKHVRLYGTPAKLIKVNSSLHAEADRMAYDMETEELALDGDVYLSNSVEEIRAAEAVYYPASDNWLLNSNQPQSQQLEIIIP